MKLKVCGMREQENIGEVLQLNPDYMGFIFYPKSPRFVDDHLNAGDMRDFPASTRKVGVFVNEDLEEVFQKVQEYRLDYVQLHGEESPQYVAELFALGIKTIKAFGVDEHFEFAQLSSYHPFVDYFLFDTKSTQKGGTGRKFDWNLLKGYDQKVPFFLSGGVDEKDISVILELKELNIHAIDVNSRFEISPGLKNVEKLKRLKKAL